MEKFCEKNSKQIDDDKAEIRQKKRKIESKSNEWNFVSSDKLLIKPEKSRNCNIVVFVYKQTHNFSSIRFLKLLHYETLIPLSMLRLVKSLVWNSQYLFCSFI